MFPLSRKRGIGDDGLEAFAGVLRLGKGILVADVEVTVVNVVENHIHPRQVVSGRVHLLAVDHTEFLYLFSYTKEERSGTAGGVIDGLNAGLSGSDEFGKNLGNLLRGVELAGGFAGAAGELTDEVFVGVAKDVGFGVVELEVDFIEGAEDIDEGSVTIAIGFTKFGGIEVDGFEEVVEIVFGFMAHGGLLNVFQDALYVFEDVAASSGEGTEEVGGREVEAEVIDGTGTDGFEDFVGLGVIRGILVFDCIGGKDAVGKSPLFFGEVFEEDESEDVVAELVGVHATPEGVGNVPELGF